MSFSEYWSGPAKNGDSDNALLQKIWYWMFVGSSAQVAERGQVSDVVENTGLIIPSNNPVAVTPSDSTPLATRAIWVGTGGDVAVEGSGGAGAAVTFKNVPSGTLIPGRFKRVMATNTTASDIVALN